MKIKLFVCIIAALLLLTGLSPWEGAGAIAPGGELPEEGFFVATNSFPRNTIVDITNIETNKTIRVIVANNLDSPGLLAIVSKEAAESIGMRTGSISRIKMVQPSDPIAFSRFTEGLGSDFLNFGSGSSVAEESLLEEIYREDAYRAPEVTVQEENRPIRPALTGPNYIIDREWREESYTVTEYTPLSAPSYVPAPFPETAPEPVNEVTEPIRIMEDPPLYIVEDIFREREREITNAIEPNFVTTVEQNIVTVPEPVRPVETVMEPVVETPVIAEVIPETPVTTPVEEIVTEIAIVEETYDHYIDTHLANEQPYEYSLLPSEEKVPEYPHSIDPALVIPEIVNVPPVQQETIYGINPALIIPEPTRAASPTAAVVTDTVFSVPRVNELNPGAYYVQIAILNSIDAVEEVITPNVRTYKPVILNAGDNQFHVLLGPLNQGESAAVLQRFRSIGYTDAFVRHVR